MSRLPVTLLIALAVPAAFAQDGAATPSRTRAEVRAELQQARAAGELEPRVEWVRGAARPKSTLTREEVVAELQAARAAARPNAQQAVASHGR